MNCFTVAVAWGLGVRSFRKILHTGNMRPSCMYVVSHQKCQNQSKPDKKLSKWSKMVNNGQQRSIRSKTVQNGQKRQQLQQWSKTVNNCQQLQQRSLRSKMVKNGHNGQKQSLWSKTVNTVKNSKKTV